MTKVDFYLLGAGGDSRERIACRLAEKAWRLGNRVYLLAPDKPATLELDELLWTFSQGSFVPHAVCTNDSDAEVHPVLIGHAEPPAALHDVLISLAPEVPTWFSRFARVAELVGAAEEDKARGRERFRFYRERGYPLEAHNL
jgi:DNA polymerase III subunit chi